MRQRNKTIAYADALPRNENLICQNLDEEKYKFFFIFGNFKLFLTTNEISRILNLLRNIATKFILQKFLATYIGKGFGKDNELSVVF